MKEPLQQNVSSQAWSNGPSPHQTLQLGKLLHYFWLLSETVEDAIPYVVPHPHLQLMLPLLAQFTAFGGGLAILAHRVPQLVHTCALLG